MKLVKIFGFVLLGATILAIGAVILGMIGSILHLLIPLAVLAAIGWVAWKLFAQGSTTRVPALPSKSADEKPEIAAKTGMSEAEALRVFEEHKKNLGP